MSRDTGGALGLRSHIHQSIGDILGTPLGSRVQRQDYGSALPDLIDRPQSGVLALQISAATYMAIARWERRIRLSRVGVRFADAGASVDIVGSLASGPEAEQPWSDQIQIGARA